MSISPILTDQEKQKRRKVRIFFTINVVVVQSLSCVRLFATPWTIHSPPGSCYAESSMGFPRPEYWNGLPFPSPESLPYPGIEPPSPELAHGFFITEPSGKEKKKKSQLLSCVQLFVTPWSVACLAPLSTEFSRQAYW